MKRTDENIQLQAIKLYTEEKLSLKQTAQKLHISMAAVMNALKRNGIDRRSVSEASKIYSFNNRYFEKIDDHTKAQMLGMIYADGNVYIKNSQWKKIFQISLSIKDQEYLEFLRQQLEYTGPLHFHYPKEKSGNICIGPTARLWISDPKLVDDLGQLGVIPRKSLILTFPTYNQVPEEYINSFVLGVMEGDGTISYHQKKNLISPTVAVRINVTKKFGKTLKSILKQKLKITSKLSLEHKYKKMENPPNVYILVVSGANQVVKFLTWIYKDAIFTMKRKHDKWIKFQEFLRWREENWDEILQQGYIKMAEKNRGTKRSEEARKKMSEAAFRFNKVRQVTIWLNGPDNLIYKITGVRPFCREYGLNDRSITFVAKGRKLYNQHKGWRRYDIESLGIPENFVELNY
jgi:predicted DNA-binding protein YlxM (UPF0122 family)